MIADFSPSDPNTPPRSPHQAYIEQSRRPIVCLVFTLPFFVIYHFGIWQNGGVKQQTVMNGADVFMRRVLFAFNLSGPLVSLFIVLATFLILQQLSGKPWRFPLRVLFLMAIESALLAVPPFLLGKLVNVVWDLRWKIFAIPSSMDFVLSFGAGVYEEFLFRMVLMGGLFWFFRQVCRLRGTKLYVTAVLVQALLFAFAHHLPGAGNPEALATISLTVFIKKMAFRTLAGVYFAYIYQERGFGVAAGCHVIYDVVAVILNAFR